MSALVLLSPELLNRKALVAVELFDPVAMTVVSQGISVTAIGLNGTPLLTWSGRFAWVTAGNEWPQGFEIDPGERPFARQVIAAPPRPQEPGQPRPTETRLARVTLRPTPAYPFTAGITVVRGQLREDAVPDAVPVEGAEVWMRWLKHPMPTQQQPNPPPMWVDSALLARTDRVGEFAALLRIPPGARPETVEVDGFRTDRLQIRIAVARNGQTRERPDPVSSHKIYEVPEGRTHELPEVLAWSELSSV